MDPAFGMKSKRKSNHRALRFFFPLSFMVYFTFKSKMHFELIFA